MYAIPELTADVESLYNLSITFKESTFLIIDKLVNNSR